MDLDAEGMGGFQILQPRQLKYSILSGNMPVKGNKFRQKMMPQVLDLT